jgi:hypothetical protein
MIKHPHRHQPLDPSKFSTLPEPFSHVIGVEVFSPTVGRGWLGFEQEMGTLAFLFMKKGRRRTLNFDEIKLYKDPMTDNLWMIFCRKQRRKSLAFILYADEASGAETYVPARVRRMIGDDDD